MRRSFNAPFWPHVLTTTSLGQEGLDFHVWCRQLLHWDLCPSPLGLEQREGRIQRFGGLSVRCALADNLRPEALPEVGEKISPWSLDGSCRPCRKQIRKRRVRPQPLVVMSGREN